MNRRAARKALFPDVLAGHFRGVGQTYRNTIAESSYPLFFVRRSLQDDFWYFAEEPSDPDTRDENSAKLIAEVKERSRDQRNLAQAVHQIALGLQKGNWHTIVRDYLSNEPFPVRDSVYQRVFGAVDDCISERATSNGPVRRGSVRVYPFLFRKQHRFVAHVPDYLQVQEVVTGATEQDDAYWRHLTYFVAEQLLALEGQAGGQDVRNAWFVPLNALGQWRGQAVWLQGDPTADPGDLAKKLMIETPTLDRDLQNGLISGILEAFGTAISRQDEVGIRDALCELWVCDWVVFLKDEPGRITKDLDVEGADIRPHRDKTVEEIRDRWRDFVAHSGGLRSTEDVTLNPWLRARQKTIQLSLGKLADDLGLTFNNVVYFCRDDLAGNSADIEGWSVLTIKSPSHQNRAYQTLTTQFADVMEKELRSRNLDNLSRALQSLGHHFGRMMKDAGVVEADCFIQKDGKLHANAWRLIAPRLHAIWGIGEVVRALRLGQEGFPSNWFDKESLEREWDSGHLHECVERLCRFYLVPRLADPEATEEIDSFAPDWKIKWTHTDGKTTESYEREFQEELREYLSDPGSLPPLPPFAHRHDQQPGTSAVSIGLAEIIRNAIKHLEAVKEREVDIRDNENQGDEFFEGTMLEIRIEHGNGWVAVDVVSAYELHPENSQPLQVRSVEDIRHLEQTSLCCEDERIVETAPPEIQEGRSPKHWVRARWKYNYGVAREHRIRQELSEVSG